MIKAKKKKLKTLKTGYCFRFEVKASETSEIQVEETENR
jgi:hypothetical protein